MSEGEQFQRCSDAFQPFTSSNLDPLVNSTINMRSSIQPTSATSPGGRNSPPAKPFTSQRHRSNGLRLGTMPKYHSAVHKSSALNNLNTSGLPRSSSRGLLSPRMQSLQALDIQRQNQQHQRQKFATLRQTSGLVGVTPLHAPSAPHILPHDSPGPATPLSLEDGGGGDYLTARNIGEGSPRALSVKSAREEQERLNGMRLDYLSPPISPRC